MEVLLCRRFLIKFDVRLASQNKRLSKITTWNIRQTEMLTLSDLIPTVSRVLIKGNNQPSMARAAVPQVTLSNSLDKPGDLMKIEAKRMSAHDSAKIAVILTA
jgi:hypothetical protein